MKKTIKILSIIIFTCMFITSCDNNIDNYKAPNGGIYGTIYDKVTGEPIPLPVQGSSGVMVSLSELNTNATASVDFRAKVDGTFTNTKVFNGDYYVKVAGPFVGICDGYATIDGQTQSDLYAIPLGRASIEASVSSDNKITINYTAEKSDPSLSLTDVSLMWNYAPGVDVNSANYATKISMGTTTSGTYVFDLPNNTQFVENNYKIKSNNNKVYVRASVTVNGKTNYSTILELQINDIY